MKTEQTDSNTAAMERVFAGAPSDTPLRTHFFTVEPPRAMRAAGYEWDHEIRVALPASYASTTKSYPVLWLTDNALEHALTALGTAELILVSVGHGRISVTENGHRRTYDFTPAEDRDLYFDGPTGKYLRAFYTSLPQTQLQKFGGAGRFLDFLVDRVRPALAAEYRMLPDDHGLLGFSQGGAFVGYTLFSRPEVFAKYICGSPGMYASNFRIFELEERYAAGHADLPATIFFGAGEAEMTEPIISGFGCLSSMAKMVETLTCRAYPSLRLTAKIFPGESHGTMIGPLINWGVRTVWGDDIAGRNFYKDMQKMSNVSPPRLAS